MKLIPWDKLPKKMQCEEVEKYYQILEHKSLQLMIKRFFDFTVALILCVVLFPVLLFIAIMIKVDSPGPVFFKQIRVTQYGKTFRIFKFRTMVVNAEQMGAQITTNDDCRITRLGKMIRGYRLDEIPQLINIIKGDMTFVGTRPEVPKYVEKYTPIMWSTLLLPAGVTSEASIRYKDEERLLEGVQNVDEVYVSRILPQKMKYNLKSVEEFNLINDFKVMLQTIGVIVR